MRGLSDREKMQMETEELEIEGRVFVPIKNGTFAHDVWVTNKVRESGLGEVVIAEGEDHAAFIERLARKAWESGALLDLMGGLYVPRGVQPKDWSPAMAAQTTEFFANVTDEAGKAQLRQQIGGLLFYFFTSALSFSETSPKFGQATEAGSAPHASGDVSTMAIGLS
jgi:hypothetical protein